MTVLGLGLVFQPILLACTYHNDTIITYTLRISIKVYTHKKEEEEEKKKTRRTKRKGGGGGGGVGMSQVAEGGSSLVAALSSALWTPANKFQKPWLQGRVVLPPRHTHTKNKIKTTQTKQNKTKQTPSEYLCAQRLSPSTATTTTCQQTVVPAEADVSKRA